MISRLFPVLNAVDGWLSGLFPFLFRLMIWGALAGTLSITIYARLSPQASIKRLKKKIRGLQREMLGLDLEFADFLRLSTGNLKTSLRLFAAVLGPGLVSALPVLLLAVWIHTCLAYDAPPTPEDLIATSVDGNIVLRLATNEDLDKLSQDEILHHDDLIGSQPVVVMADDKIVYSGDPLSPPTQIVHKRRWWSVLLNSPAGYVVEDAPVDSIRLNVFRKHVVEWGPNWTRGWEFTFFVFVFIAALGIKLGFRIA